MWAFLKKFISQHLGLLLLILILLFISIQTIKPSFAMLGWDNYSSVLDFKINFFRTFFATWREYRGLGVPSDSETTDIFRQLFYLVTSAVLPNHLLDQAYHLFALWVGVLSFYQFSRLLISETNLKKTVHTLQKQDLFAAIAAFFYLFNLNTLSIFYSPMIPFTNRFYGLPLILWLFLKLKQSQHKLKNLILLSLAIILTAGSYITATVIITTIIALGVFLIFQTNLKKSIIYGLGFVILNSFWLLPFANYVQEKSAITPQARIFIEINEFSINKPLKEFSLFRQALLYPSFLEMQFPTIDGSEFLIHPLVKELQNPTNQVVLFLFPALYLISSALILSQAKKNHKILWIPTWILLFLFLSAKEYSPLGFVYIFLKKYIPFFEVLFRIADTKFHFYISLAGSIAAAYAIFWLINKLQIKIVKKIAVIFFAILSMVYAYQFRSYLNGNLLGFVYNKVPTAYYQIANTINQDPDRGRVVHLPMDPKHHYWRSYQWGYLGSAFFNFMINKPYIDNTFEPGSMENAYLNAEIVDLTDRLDKALTANNKQKVATQFVKLLQQVGVKYLIMDYSLEAEVYPRNIKYNQPQASETRELVSLLRRQDQIQLIESHNISLIDQYKLYQNLFPQDIPQKLTDLPPQTKIELYQVPSPQPVFEFANGVQHLDPNLEAALETPVQQLLENDYIQAKDKDNIVLPLLRPNHQVEISEGQVKLEFPLSKNKLVNYQVTTQEPKVDSYLIDVTGQVINNQIILNFYHRYLPDINGQQFKHLIATTRFELSELKTQTMPKAWIAGDWTQLDTQGLLDHYRLRVNQVSLPLPDQVLNQPTAISSFMLHDKTLEVELLEKQSVQNLSWDQALVPKAEDCFGLKHDNSAGSHQIQPDGALTIDVNNQSYCLIQNLSLSRAEDTETNPNLKQHLELSFNLRGSTEKNTGPYRLSGYEPLIKKVVKDEGTLPVTARVCIKTDQNNKCLNSSRFLRVYNSNHQYRLTLNKPVSSLENLNIELVSLPMADYSQSITLDSALIEVFMPVVSEKIEFNPAYEPESVVISAESLKLSFPQPVSKYSYVRNWQAEAFNVPLALCPKPSSEHDKEFKYFKDKFVTLIKNCGGMYYAQPFIYYLTSPYLFGFEYAVAAGQQPMMLVSQSGVSYVDERVGLLQGYPDIKNLRQFQDRQLGADYQSTLAEFEQLEFNLGSKLVMPQPNEQWEVADMNLHLFQGSNNDAVMASRKFYALELPADWAALKLEPAHAQTDYLVPQAELSYEKILPSLWKVTLQGNKASGTSLLKFNEGYDRQWGVYQGLGQMLLNQKTGTTYRCNGFSNCFEINWNEIGNAKQLYIFYWPEVLYAVGWVLTLSSLAGLILWLKTATRELKK